MYNLDGGTIYNSPTASTYVAGVDEKIYLAEPYRLNYDFDGYYLDSSFTQAVAKDDVGYYLTPSDGTLYTEGFDS